MEVWFWGGVSFLNEVFLFLEDYLMVEGWSFLVVFFCFNVYLFLFFIYKKYLDYNLYFLEFFFGCFKIINEKI